MKYAVLKNNKIIFYFFRKKFLSHFIFLKIFLIVQFFTFIKIEEMHM